LYAAIVVAAGICVAHAGNEIAEHEFAAAGGPVTLGRTFVGTLFVAVATSLPEVTVAFGAVSKARSADMALGTILGSNSINLVIFAIGAPFLMFHRGLSGWSEIPPIHMVNVVVALVLTLFVLAGMRAKVLDSRPAAARAATAVLVPIYLVGLLVIYRGGAG
jgi:cation:H+ antiporter